MSGGRGAGGRSQENTRVDRGHVLAARVVGSSPGHTLDE